MNYIIDSRLKRRKLEYLVHWKGYDDSDRMWEPKFNLGNAKDAIWDFHASHSSAPHTLSIDPVDFLLLFQKQLEPFTKVYPHHWNNPKSSQCIRLSNRWCRPLMEVWSLSSPLWRWNSKRIRLGLPVNSLTLIYYPTICTCLYWIYWYWLRRAYQDKNNMRQLHGGGRMEEKHKHVCGSIAMHSTEMNCQE